MAKGKTTPAPPLALTLKAKPLMLTITLIKLTGKKYDAISLFRGSHGSLFLQPLGAVDGQGYSVPISGFGSGGSFGGSFGGSNRRHIRGCSSG